VAAVEGATPSYSLFAIKLRYLSPTILFVTILSMINSFKVFREVYLLTGDYPYEGLYMLQHFMNNTFNSLDYQKLSAAAVVMALFMVGSYRADVLRRGQIRKGRGGMRKKRYFGRFAMFLLCAVFAVAFSAAHRANYHQLIHDRIGDHRQLRPGVFHGQTQSYQSGFVNLKLIPDKVSFSQYINGLVRSPDYLIKFWNSVILVVPIVVFQVAIASVAAYAFTRWRGKVAGVHILLLCDTDADALSGHAGAELPGQQMAGDNKYPLGHRAARHIRSVFGVSCSRNTCGAYRIRSSKPQRWRERGSGTSSPAYACPSAARPLIPLRYSCS
jgi:ABC-type sugar transport system permease subunit